MEGAFALPAGASHVLLVVALVCALHWVHLEVSQPRHLRALVGIRGWRALQQGEGLPGNSKLVDETALDVTSSVLSVIMFGRYLKAAWDLAGSAQLRLAGTTHLSTSTFVLHAAYTVETPPRCCCYNVLLVNVKT
jgi:hypothetical protein